MAARRRNNITESDLSGFKHGAFLLKLLDNLRDAGCARDRAGNRLLHMDQLVSLYLLYMFNPICSSLRAMQQASELKKVQSKLKVPRASLGSLSEAASVFDASLLEPVIEALVERVPVLGRGVDQRLKDIHEVIALFDGTWLPRLPRLVAALWHEDKDTKVKAHTEYELLKGVPVDATITRGMNQQTDERTVLSACLKSGRLYVLDRGYAAYGLLQQIIDIGSGFVCRIRDNANYDVIEECALSAQAIESGVVRDVIVNLGGKSSGLRQAVRLVEIKCTPHKMDRPKVGRGGPSQGQTMLLATNRLDLDVEVVSLVYQQRWTIEVFFRFFKHVLGCRHLLSYCDNGIRLQTYVAIIACLLIALWTGRKPTLRTYEMICWRLSGMASDEELAVHIEGLKDQNNAPVA